MKSDSKLGKRQQKEEWQVPWIEEIIILQLVSPKSLSKDILMAKTMRKNDLIIWIMARNYLNSCLNVSWEENLTLVVYLGTIKVTYSLHLSIILVGSEG